MFSNIVPIFLAGIRPLSLGYKSIEQIGCSLFGSIQCISIFGCCDHILNGILFTAFEHACLHCSRVFSMQNKHRVRFFCVWTWKTKQKLKMLNNPVRQKPCEKIRMFESAIPLSKAYTMDAIIRDRKGIWSMRRQWKKDSSIAIGSGEERENNKNSINWKRNAFDHPKFEHNRSCCTDAPKQRHASLHSEGRG